MPANMRAQGSALYLFVINLIGEPSAVAWCTDYVFQDPNKVNLSLMWVGTFFGLLSAVLLYFGSKHYRSTLNYLETYNEKQMAEMLAGMAIFFNLTCFFSLAHRSPNSCYCITSWNFSAANMQSTVCEFPGTLNDLRRSRHGLTDSRTACWQAG